MSVAGRRVLSGVVVGFSMAEVLCCWLLFVDVWCCWLLVVVDCCLLRVVLCCMSCVVVCWSVLLL